MTRLGVVYGADDRTEVYQAAPNRADVARRSAVAMIPQQYLERGGDGRWTLVGPTVQARHSVCPTERFASQPADADCSATLIDADLVLTAGHCVTTESQCASYAYVFNYWYAAPDELAPIDDETVYTCQRRVLFEQNVLGTAPIDVAVVQLDRAVSPRYSPARISAATIAIGTSIFLVGAGEGSPMKIASGATVQAYVGAPATGFQSDVDSFLGASGAGLFLEDGSLTGVLSSGRNDFGADGGCRRERTLDEVQGGETAYWAALAPTMLCPQHSQSPSLCGAMVDAAADCCSDTARTAPPAPEGVPAEDARAASAPSPPGCSVAKLDGTIPSWLWSLFLLVPALSRIRARTRAPTAPTGKAGRS